MKNSIRLAVALLILASSACNLTRILDSPTPTATQPEERPAITSTPPSPAGSTIILHNNSGQTIFFAYVSSCSDSTWGEDDLGSSTVADGSTFTFQVEEGCYDLKAEDSNSSVIDSEMGVNVSGTYDWYVTSSSGGQPQSGSASIVLHNNSSQTIYFAYVSSCSDSTWGDDDLGSSTVPAGGSFTFSVAPGCYDLKAEDSNHTVIETEMGVNVSGTYNWSVTSSGGQPSGSSNILLQNNSGQTIFYAYVSPCTSSTWGSDALGSSTVPNGGTFNFSVAPGCYDLKAEDSNHTVIETEMGVNVSGTYNWSVTSSGGQPSGSSSIILHNNSGQTIWYAYVSSCSDSTWGDDDLGSSTVPNGSTFTFSVPAGCYDLKAEGSNHTVIETQMGANVSGTYNWYVP